MNNNSDFKSKNRAVAGIVAGVVISMVALSYASVPLYKIFCQVTGYGGTTQVSDVLPDKILDRTVTVQFYADTARDLPWVFKPGQRDINVKIGQKGLAYYTAESTAAEPVAGTAIYNVTPAKLGKYFHKVECFCFGEQVLVPGQKQNMPVLFYIDPEMDDDPAMDDVNVVTLSYTFYKTESKALDEAVEAFYNQEDVDEDKQKKDDDV